MKRILSKTWIKCLVLLKDRIGDDAIDRWLRQVSTYRQGTDFRLYAPSLEVLNKIKSEFLPQIKECLKEIDPEIKSVTLFKIKTASSLNTDNRQDYVGVDFRQSFSNFVVGKTNQFAHNLCYELANNLKDKSDHILIQGDYGMGKTHLLNATTLLLKEKNPSLKILYVNAERFVVDMVAAIQTGELETFRADFRSCNVLLIDDSHFFINKSRSQEELMNIILYLRQLGVPVVMSIGQHPDSFEAIDKRFKSFFQWCVYSPIDSPDEDTKQAIIVRKVAAMYHDPLDEDVQRYLAKNFFSNIRQLEGALLKLTMHARFTNETISLEFAKRSFGETLQVKQRNITVIKIQHAVAIYYKITIEAMVGKSRTKSVVLPRQIAMYLSRKLTSMSLPEIGKNFSNRDHATIIYACRVLEEKIEKNDKLRKEVEKLETVILNT